jgi:hypothetical protein
MTSAVFSVQDETGTVYQVTIQASPSFAVAVGDTGNYSGIPDDGTDGFAPATSTTVNFQVTQVLDAEHFSIRTLTEATADWPRSGTITWTTGSNATLTATALSIDPANAYINTSFLAKYHSSRGNAIPASATTAAQQAAIVKATDYLDQRYRYNGVKLIQKIGTSPQDSNAVFLEPWLTPYALNNLYALTPSTTPQFTQWPRQGVTDLSGDTVNGIPLPIQMACAELALRVLNGINLQPDYDQTLVSAGGVLQSSTKEVGPIKVTNTYDTKLGLGFFADFPQITRMLTASGLVMPNRGRTVMR